MDIDLLDPATADLDELANLQREAFKGVAGTSALSTVVGNLQSAEHYRRKYHSPAGKALIVAIREHGRLMAMAAMVPETLTHESGTTLGWQVCDLATHPDARSHGLRSLFRTCMKTLTARLADDEVIFGYPNANSMPGIVRLGWSKRAVLDAYVGLVPAIGDSREIHPMERFDSRVDQLAKRLMRPGTVCIERSAAYLNWRYFSSPQSPYTALVYDAGSGIEGYTVVRCLPMRSRSVCVILELFAVSPEVERVLLPAAIRWGWRMRAWPTLLFSNCWGERAWLRHGMARLPRRLSPRQLVLMCSAAGNAGRNVFELEWRASLGDWDVF